MLKLKVFFNRLLYYFLSILMIALVLLIFVNVILRWFGSNIFWSEEVSTLLFVWIIYIGTIAAYKKNRLIAVEIVYNKLKGKAKNILSIINILLTALLLIVLIVSSVKLVLVQLKTISMSLMIPYSVFTLPAMICFSVIFILKGKYVLSKVMKKDKN